MKPVVRTNSHGDFVDLYGECYIPSSSPFPGDPDKIHVKWMITKDGRFKIIGPIETLVDSEMDYVIYRMCGSF
jgi:hypothetical protein